MRVYLAKNLREANQSNALDNRKILGEKRILLINIIGSPGSGKTTLLEHTLKIISKGYRAAVIEADLYTSEDSGRLEPWCETVLQINTEGGCHLEAGYIGHLLTAEAPYLLDMDIIFIENIGNLICPAEFDLGEDLRVTLLTVTEGNDKPRKYPLAYQDSQATLITKTDLLPYCSFDLNEALNDLSMINSAIKVFPLSVQTGNGIGDWIQWLKAHVEAKKNYAGN